MIYDRMIITTAIVTDLTNFFGFSLYTIANVISIKNDQNSAAANISSATNPNAVLIIMSIYLIP